jgi:hypothetical protein
MTPTPPRPAATLPIEIPPDLQVVYANLARIAHAPTEFVIDYARFLPGDTKATVVARVVISPLAAKLLLQALTENVARYETNFGTINVPTPSTLADNLFRPFQPPPDSPPPPEDKK